jgi:hypothetical protein
MWTALRRFACGLRGHSIILELKRARVCLRCLDCGQESAGWALTAAAPVFRGVRIARFKRRLAT